MFFTALFLFAHLAPAAGQVQGQWFDKYMVILLENMDLNDILSNPTFSKVASPGILLRNFHGVAHPSQQN